MTNSISNQDKQAFSISLFLVLIGVCAALHIWKLPPALPVLKKELVLDLVDSGFLLSTVQLGGMLLGLTMGLFAERIGLRRCVLAGLAILSITSAATPLFSTKELVLFCRAIEGCGFLMVVLPIPALFKRIVPASMLSRVMGFWGSYMPAGAVTILLVGSWLLSISSWRMVWLLLAGVTFVVFCFAVWLVPNDRNMTSATAAKRGEAPLVLTMVLTTLSSGRVWLIALIFGVYAAQWASVIGFLPTFYAAAELSGMAAGVLTALVAGSNMIGNISAGRLLHKGVPIHRIMIIAFVFMISCAVIAFGIAESIAVQFAAVLLFSIMGGLIPATLFYLAVTYAPTPETTTSTVGWVQQCSSMGQFVGPPIVAWVVSALGGWQWAWVATSLFALLGIGMTWLLIMIKKDKLLIY